VRADWKDFVALVLAAFQLVLPAVVAMAVLVLLVWLALRAVS